MLGSDTTWATLLPAVGLRLDCCLIAGLVASLVGFVTVTPAIVTLCRNDDESMTPRDLAGIAVVASLTAAVCIGAHLTDSAVGQLLLCALPLLALWSGHSFGFVGLGLCLLTAALLLQSLDGLQLFLFATATCSLAHTSSKLTTASRLVTLTKALRVARARLRDSIERQNLVLRTTHDAIVCWNVRRDCMRWNSSARSYFGCLPHVSGGWRLWSACIEEGDRARVLDELRQLLDGGGKHWRGEFQIRRRDGRVVPIRCRGILVRDVKGRPWRMVAALRDISDARRAEESSRALARSARLATIGEITATITHEVNQPLAAILNNAETALLLLRDGKARSDTIKEILEDIRDDDLRASQIVRRTRALLQNKELARERIDLNDIVTRAVKVLSQDARRRTIRLSVSLSAIPPVHADALHLEQVVINIINNALDAAGTSHGSRRLVEVFTRCSRARVQVGVRDTGCGIPAADLERIFESRHTTKADGLGLGLSLARAIVTAHGGRIFAENNKHASGATVCFELPAIETFQASVALSESD
jgi:PAS domain S-box-containing protein